MLEKLIDLVFPPRADENLVRNAHPFDVAALVAPNLISVGTHTVTTLLPFSNPLVRALIHEAKYHKNRRAFSLLGDMLGEYFTEKSAEEGWGTIRIVPVPLSQKRKRERGYNQVEEILRRASPLPGEIESSVLVRLHDTPSQTTLSGKARWENMRGAFGAARPLNSAFTYIILDDVLTTGATMRAAIDTLVIAGANKIIPLALAH